MLYNPSAIKLGGTAVFAIQTFADFYPVDKIRWFVESDRSRTHVTFPNGNCGESVKIRADGSEGTIKIKAVLPGLDKSGPEFSAKVLKEEKVKITFYIGYDEAGVKLLNDTQINTILQVLNEIYAQAAMKFKIYPVKKAGIDKYLKLVEYRDVSTDERFNNLINLDGETNGIEAYFVEKLEKGTRGLWRRGGIGIAVRDEENNIRDPYTLATTLAHEIGHACGLYDIYDKREPGEDLPEIDVCENIIDKDKLPEDCSIIPYYNRSLGYCDLLQRLLMYGHYTVGDTKKDIPVGTVYGLESDCSIKWVKVGLNDMNRKPESN